MALRCVTCGAENPATNRFCGQCGIQLARVTGNPEEFWRRTRAGSFGPMETSRVTAESKHVRESRGEALRWNAATAASTGNHGISGNAVDGAPANSGATQPPNKYRFVIERENTLRTGFLGLSDDGTSGYDDEEPESSSHLWRNIAICVIAVAVSLTAWQWRSIRDYGLLLYGSASGLDGFRGASPRNTGMPNPPAVAAESASRTLGPAAEADTPEVIGSSSSGADHARPVQQTGTSRRSAPGAATSNQSAHVIKSPHAMGAPLPDIPEESQSPVVSNRASNFRESRTSDPAGNLPRTVLPGAYEMNRAAHSGDAELRAMWLWKAVAKENPQAPVELARMYAQGSGVVRNCQQAQVLLRSAAKNGNEQAKLSLQQILLQGGCSTR